MKFFIIVYLLILLLNVVAINVTAQRVIQEVRYHGNKVGLINREFTLDCHQNSSESVFWKYHNRLSNDDERTIYVHGGIYNGFQTRMEVNSTTYSLTIKSVSWQDAGDYSCIEKDGLGTRHVTHFYVSDAADDIDDVKNVEIGMPIYIPCTLPTISSGIDWYHQQYCNDERGLRACGVRRKLTSNDKQYELNMNGIHISRVENDMNGLFTCNSSLHNHYRVLLNVYPVSLELGHIGYPLALRCKTVGDEDVVWKYQKPDDSSVNWQLLSANQHRYTFDNEVLTIKVMSPDDIGSYICLAGHEIRNYFNITVADSFLPFKRNAVAGHPEILDCLDKPNLPISWSFHPASNPNDNVDIVFNGEIANGLQDEYELLDNSRLVIKSVTLKHHNTSFICMDQLKTQRVILLDVHDDFEGSPPSDDMSPFIIGILAFLNLLLLFFLVVTFCLYHRLKHNKRDTMMETENGTQDHAHMKGTQHHGHTTDDESNDSLLHSKQPNGNGVVS